MPQCAIFRILATVIDYFSLLVTACHRLFTYAHAGTCHRWKERASSRTIHWKEQASSRSRRHVFHPDEFFSFTGYRSKYIREHVHAASVSITVTNVRTYVRTQPTVSIEEKQTLQNKQNTELNCQLYNALTYMQELH